MICKSCGGHVDSGEVCGTCGSLSAHRLNLMMFVLSRNGRPVFASQFLERCVQEVRNKLALSGPITVRTQETDGDCFPTKYLEHDSFVDTWTLNFVIVE